MYQVKVCGLLTNFILMTLWMHPNRWLHRNFHYSVHYAVLLSQLFVLLNMCYTKLTFIVTEMNTRNAPTL